MTEREYTIEMLCCIPFNILQQRINHEEHAPSWLGRIDDTIINEALSRYNEESFRKAREESMKAL